MAEIVLSGVTKRYPDGTTAVQDLDLSIADREFIILVGPSGCGKSTTLNMIAGLEDISEGEPGVPLRLLLRVLQADGCTPVSGAEVEIWYCNTEGVYSGDDVEGGDFCTGGEAAAEERYYFRGRALSDDSGKVTFDGCFPGWYSGRSIHIHLLVRPAENAGESTTENAIAVSQLFFPEALTQEIFESVVGYASRGQPDTSFESDNVLTSVEDITPYVLDYARMSDGAMLAWKNIVLSDTESCGSSGGGPGGGGPPPGGMPPG